MASSSFEGIRCEPRSNISKEPSFSKCFSKWHDLVGLRLPPNWVQLFAADVPFDCVLVMPNGFQWKAKMLNIASGCQFTLGYGDNLIFTYVGDDEFHARRYNFLTGCPPRVNYDGSLYGEPEPGGEPNVISSNDYTS